MRTRGNASRTWGDEAPGRLIRSPGGSPGFGGLTRGFTETPAPRAEIRAGGPGCCARSLVRPDRRLDRRVVQRLLVHRRRAACGGVLPAGAVHEVLVVALGLAVG